MLSTIRIRQLRKRGDTARRRPGVASQTGAAAYTDARRADGNAARRARARSASAAGREPRARGGRGVAARVRAVGEPRGPGRE
jgi:hypothetical protein